MLSVTIENLNNTVMLKCRGRIVLGEETQLLCAALPYYGREIIMDLAEVTTIDAAGIGALVTLQAAGIYFKLENPNEHVREVLRLTNLESVVEVCGPALPQLARDRFPAGPLACCFATGD